MQRLLTRREHEILILALKRAADFETTDLNKTAAALLLDLAREVEARPLRAVA